MAAWAEKERVTEGENKRVRQRMILNHLTGAEPAGISIAYPLGVKYTNIQRDERYRCERSRGKEGTDRGSTISYGQ